MPPPLRAACLCVQVAMENQNLGKKEILNVRWAHDDPNPIAKRPPGPPPPPPPPPNPGRTQ